MVVCLCVFLVCVDFVVGATQILSFMFVFVCFLWGGELEFRGNEEYRIGCKNGEVVCVKRKSFEIF